MRKHYWPNYTWRHFFGFNTLLLTLDVTAILVYDALGGNWIIFPLVLLSERWLNGFWHLRNAPHPALFVGVAVQCAVLDARLPRRALCGAAG